MNLEIAMDCLHDETEDYTNATESEIVDKGRWNTFYQQVFEKKEDGTFWEISWSRGSTEYQDDGPEDIRFRRVFPRYKTITVYE